MVARNPRARKRRRLKKAPVIRLLESPTPRKRLGSLDFDDHRLDRGRQRLLLGAAGRAGTAHIMQFRPVGVECPDEELAPKCPDVGAQAGFAVSAGCRGGERSLGGGCHDAALTVF